MLVSARARARSVVLGRRCAPRTRSLSAAAVGTLLLLAIPGVAGAAAPAPCDGVPQVTDVQGDGHHASTDVLRAWLSEASGHLQAVVDVNVGTFAPEHLDADINGSGFAFVFTVAGQTRYVRATAPPPNEANVSFDVGTYNPATPGRFVSAGPTTGTVARNPIGHGTVTIDIPVSTGAVTPAHLTQLFVLTYDGITNDVPGWVDRAPGGVLPDEASFGADYVLGSCDAGAGGGGGGGPVTTTAVRMAAPTSLKGGGNAVVTGSVVPARGGVPVVVTASAATTTKRTVRTAADGRFRMVLPVRETTIVRAQAEGIGSPSATVVVRATVHLVSNRRSGGITRIRGVIAPGLPGRILLIRTTAFRPSLAITTTGKRSFTFRIRHPQAGRYQLIYIPSGERAERTTSRAFTVRSARHGRLSATGDGSASRRKP